LDIAARAKRDLDILGQIEQRLSRGDILARLKLRILDVLARVETNDSAVETLQKELAGLLIADHDTIDLSDSKKVIDRLLGSAWHLDPETAADLAMLKIELLEKDSGATLEFDTDEYRLALIDLNQRLLDLPPAKRTAIARSFSSTPILFTSKSSPFLRYDGVNDADVEVTKKVAAALEARLSLVNTLITAAPDRPELLTARGVTYEAIAVQIDLGLQQQSNDTARQAQWGASAKAAVKDLTEAIERAAYPAVPGGARCGICRRS
jgi:hypothetical protein